MRYLVQNMKITNGDILVLDLMPAVGEKVISFLPGQYAMLAFYDERGKLTSPHAFSLASSPEQIPLLQFGIKIKGRFTQGLAKLRPGDRVFVYGPYGEFTFNPNTDLNAVFIAGGVGITPLMSSIRYAADRQLQNRLTLFYSNREANKILYYDDIKKLEAENKNFKAIFAVTDETGPVSDRQMIRERLNVKIISEALDDKLYGKTFFICGPRPFMDSIVQGLRDMGVDKKAIRTEAFSMMPRLTLRENMLNLTLVYGGSAALMAAAVIWIYGIAKAQLTENPSLKTNLIYSPPQVQEIQKNAFRAAVTPPPSAASAPAAPAASAPAVPSYQPTQTPAYTPPAPLSDYQTRIRPRTTVS